MIMIDPAGAVSESKFIIPLAKGEGLHRLIIIHLLAKIQKIVFIVHLLAQKCQYDQQK